MKKDIMNYLFGFAGLCFLFAIAYELQNQTSESKTEFKKLKNSSDTLKVEPLTPTVDSSVFYRDSIQIIKRYVSSPNSAGGVDLNIIWKNKFKRTVKYASFQVAAINAVDDEVYSTISAYDYTQWVKSTGPIKYNQIDGYGTHWSCVWYNHTIKRCKIKTVRLEFMDGSKIEFSI